MKLVLAEERAMCGVSFGDMKLYRHRAVRFAQGKQEMVNRY